MAIDFFKETLESLERQFKNRQTLNRKETAGVIGIGLSTLDLRIKEGRNIPKYIKIGDAKNSRIVFTLVAIAQYLTNAGERSTLNEKH